LIQRHTDINTVIRISSGFLALSLLLTADEAAACSVGMCQLRVRKRLPCVAVFLVYVACILCGFAAAKTYRNVSSKKSLFELNLQFWA